MRIFLQQAKEHFIKLTLIKKISFLLLCIAAIVSVGQGLSNAQRFSQDFQWSPSVLFLEGTNPYEHYLSGNNDQRIILSQDPNYAHGLYIVLAPFAALDWSHARIVWSLVNVLASLLIAVLIGRQAGLVGLPLLVLVLAFLCSTPFRNNLGNGQQAAFTLLPFCALFMPNPSRSSFWSGFAYFKYSFAPPLAAYIFFKRGARNLVLSLVPGLLGYGIFLARVGGDPVTVLMQPLKVGAETFGLGEADFMSLASLFYPEKQGLLFMLIFYTVPLCISTLLAFFAARTVADKFLSFSIICVISLLCFKHLRYDFIFLLPAFACALKNYHEIASKIILLAIIFNWYGLKLFDAPSGLLQFEKSKPSLLLLNFILCIAILSWLFVIGRRKEIAISTERA